MISLFQPGEAVTMAGFNQRLQGILSALPSQNLKIAAGSYVGTGASGSSNPNSLSFNFAPVLLVVQSDHQTTVTELSIIQGCTYAQTQMSSVGSGQTWGQRNHVTFSNNGKVIQWYGDGFSGSSDNIYGQLNVRGIIYRYFAIGA